MKKGLFVLPLIALLVSGCNLTTPRKNGKKTSGEDTTQSSTSSTSSSSRSTSSSQSGSSSTSSSTPGPTDVYPTSISIDETKNLAVGESFTFTVEFYPANTTVKKVTWVSSDSETVKTTSSGTITALKEGNATITAKAVGENYTTVNAECSVTVDFKKTHFPYNYDDYISNNAYAFSNTPVSGEPKLLIIPVWFSDSSNYITNQNNVRSDIQKAYLGTNDETGWRSVKTYYEEESQGIVSLQGTVTDWYSYSSSSQTVGSNGSYTQDILTKAVDWYFKNNTSDSRLSYDTNGDGYLDGVMLIYAAPDNRSSGSGLSNLWAYTSWLMDSPSVSSPSINVFFWASYDFMYGSNIASSRTGKSGYAGGDTDHCNLDAHTFIHEMGHVFGLEDYYDYSGQYSPSAGFSMQDYNVGGHDPYSVMAYGWADPYIPTSSRTITIKDFQSSHDLILLANHTVTSPFDEYILLELYSPTGLNKLDSDYQYEGGYPQGPSSYGLRVWHVDARLTYWTGSSWSKNMTTNPYVGNIYHAMANTYASFENHGSPLGTAYQNYNLLQLIRNSATEGHQTTSMLSDSHLFKQSSSFSMSTYSKQFVNSTNMNDGKALGWTFSVSSISGNEATISVVKQ